MVKTSDKRNEGFGLKLMSPTYLRLEGEFRRVIIQAGILNRFQIGQVPLVELFPLFPCNAESKARFRVTSDIGKSLVSIKG